MSPSKKPQNDRLTIEWYYTHGIVATFERDQLTVISLSNGTLISYPGFLAYSNEIIRGLRLTDKKQRILDTLGKPTKIETSDLPAGTDPDIPVAWPKESRYYWRLTDYTLEVDLLNQAQSVSDEKRLTLPKDSVTHDSGHEISRRPFRRSSDLPRIRLTPLLQDDR